MRVHRHGWKKKSAETAIDWFRFAKDRSGGQKKWTVDRAAINWFRFEKDRRCCQKKWTLEQAAGANKAAIAAATADKV